jgi:serine O-acetyltransferase
MEQWINKHLPRLVSDLSPCHDCPVANTEKVFNLPGQKAVVEQLENLVGMLFPGCHGHAPLAAESAEAMLRRLLADTALQLRDQTQRAFAYQCEVEKCRNCGDCRHKATRAVTALLDQLPRIRAVLQEDIVAAYEGDPAARSTMEIVMSYPGLYAITVQRIAHALYLEKVPLIPRVMSEHAHARTGIDIHPGARIGPGFFIDHGTGVVIGETCVIGRHVKLYQGVTLGALSFAKDAKGHLIKGTKRHPNVEDNVVIYAGATILGGETTIGHDSTIGANVWLIHSVPPHSKVYNQEPKPYIKPARKPHAKKTAARKRQ